MTSGHYFKRWKQWQISFSWALNHCRWWLQPWNQMIASWQESYDKTKLWPRQCVEKHSADKGPYSQGYGLPTGHIQLWELDHKEGRVPKNWCLWTVALEKTPQSPLDSEIKPVNLKGNQPWTLIGKVPDAGKDWKQKRVSEDEMAGWHHWYNGHELGQTPGDGEGQGGLVCCSPWGCKKLDITGRLNNNNGIMFTYY